MKYAHAVMKLKVNVQLASWATWNEFQGAHFFELKLRGPKGHALPYENFQILGAFWCILVHSGQLNWHIQWKQIVSTFITFI